MGFNSGSQRQRGRSTGVDPAAQLHVYDALYVALASHLDIPLLTADPRLRREPGLTCHTEFV